MTPPDRVWLWSVFHHVSWQMWTTPYLAVVFGRYWRISYGIGPFYGSFGYVESF